ncbi:MAG TPA: Rieske (2Fe-2S) protein [Methanoregulaceae archaeon]|nr:Rieske (2Fe-2S) protein [Methanoregulaceae archaeon]
MTYTKAGDVKDPGEGVIIGTKIADKDILVVNLGGTLYAIGNKCTHMGCRLSMGKRDGDQVKCKCHGSVFSLKTGEVIHGPAKNPETSYKVKIENGEVMIDI